MHLRRGWSLWVALVLCASGCRTPESRVNRPSETGGITGAWRSQIQFETGAFAAIKDLEFMIVFNRGGTMTESSNYDGAPPVPPAYGAWSRVSSRRFVAKYAFYSTKPPGSFDEIAQSGGWMPAGHGELTERITLSKDGKTYASTLTYAGFDASGRPIAGGGTGRGSGRRLFQ